MDVSHRRVGLGWGTGPVSVALALIMVGFVAFVAMTGKDVRRR